MHAVECNGDLSGSVVNWGLQRWSEWARKEGAAVVSERVNSKTRTNEPFEVGNLATNEPSKTKRCLVNVRKGWKVL